MVRIGYKGDMRAFNIKVGGMLITNWDKDEVRDFSDKDVRLLLKNPEFYIVSGKTKKKEEIVKEEVTEEPEEVKFDFDGDGDFDKDDVSLGAKAMAASRKLKD